MDTSSPQLYATDLTDGEWALLRPLLPAQAHTGRPRLHSPRTILNAIFYVLRTGCAWRFLPQEWPAWQTVYHYFRAWRLDGTWERLHHHLRERLRRQLGRDPQPSAGSIDSQCARQGQTEHGASGKLSHSPGCEKVALRALRGGCWCG